MDALVRKIKKLQRITPDTSWLESQRSFLLYEISRAKETQQRKRAILAFPLFNFFKVFKPAFAFALIAIVLISSISTIGVISASQQSLPGDFLYPVKTALEQTQLTFNPSPESRTKLSIKFASQRIDEITQLMEKPDKTKDIQKTVQKFTQEIVSAQQNISALKEKNAQKALEIAKIVKAQTPAYEEVLNKSADKLSYILPEERETISANINQALEAVGKIKEITDELTKDESLSAPQSEPEQSSEQEIITPLPEQKIESNSIPFESIQPQENGAENKAE